MRALVRCVGVSILKVGDRFLEVHHCALEILLVIHCLHRDEVLEDLVAELVSPLRCPEEEVLVKLPELFVRYLVESLDIKGRISIGVLPYELFIVCKEL